MEISKKRLNDLTNLAVTAAMSVLKAGLPEFSASAMKDLKEDIEMNLSDTIESHISALTEEDCRKVSFKKPF